MNKMDTSLPEVNAISKKPIFYLDWNLISYLYDPNTLAEEKRVQVLCMQTIISIINPNSMILPYSIAHFADIRRGAAEQQIIWLDFMEKLTRKWKVGEIHSDRNNVGLIQIQSIHNDFTEYCKEMMSSESQEAKMQKIISPFLSAQRDDAIKSIENNLGGYNKEILNWILKLLKKDDGITGIDILRMNKRFRQNLHDKHGKPFKYPEAKHILQEKKKDIFLQSIDEAIAKSSMPYKSFEELDKAISNFGTFGFLSPFMEKVNRLSMLAMILGIGSEKLKKDNAFKSIISDLYHLTYGLRCNYFVTEDTALLERSVFIKRMMDLHVKIFRTDTLNKLLLTQLTPHYKPKKEEEITSEEIKSGDGVTFCFKEKDGKEIWSYTVKTPVEEEGL